MTSVLENGPVYSGFKSSSRARLAELSPSSNAINDQFVEATIALVWPYSSSTRQLSLLLAEKDVSLRKAKGQVKVTFAGPAAKEVAHSKAGIGDSVRLSLEGVSWIESNDNVATPGKKVEWDLSFEKRLKLEIFRDDGLPTLLDFVAPVHSPTIVHNDRPVLSTPRVNGTVLVPGTKILLPSIPFPGSSRRTLSTVSTNLLPNPFAIAAADGDRDVADRSRKRTKFSRYSGQWKLADEPDNGDYEALEPSPTRPIDRGTHDVGNYAVNELVEDTHAEVLETSRREQVFRATQASQRVPDLQQLPIVPVSPDLVESRLGGQDEETLPILSSPDASMLPPPRRTQRLFMPSTPEMAFPEENRDLESVNTPRLIPIASPGLGLISPLVTRREYFPITFGLASELDASGSRRFAASQTDSSAIMPSHRLETSAGNPHPPSPQRIAATQTIDLDFLEQHVEQQQTSAYGPTQTEIVEDEDMYGPPVVRVQEREVLGERSQRTFHDVDPAPAQSPTTKQMAEFIDLDKLSEDEADETVLTSRTPVERPITDLDQRLVDEDVVKANPRSHLFRTDGTSDRNEATSPTNDYNVLEQTLQKGAPAEPPEDVPIEAREAGMEMLSESLLPERTLDSSDQQKRREHPSSPIHVVIDLIDEEDEVPTAKVQASQKVVESEGLAPIEEELAITTETIRHPQLVGRIPDTPQATQIISGQDEVDELPMAQSELPPTPVNSQQIPELHQLSQDIGTSFGQQPDDGEPLLPPQPSQEPTPARRESQRLLKKPHTSDQIVNEYFTPRKPLPLAIGSSTIRKENVASSTRRRLRSSSPQVPTSPTTQQQTRTSTNPASSPKSTPKFRATHSSSQQGIITSLSYYPTLSSLPNYFEQVVDVFGVCTADGPNIERAKTGPKDYYTTLHLADDSRENSDNTTITAQLLRPRKIALPVPKCGDVMLFRDMKVQTRDGKPMLLTTNSSAWAVFHIEDDNDENISATVSGPPIEYGEMEESRTKQLHDWWIAEGQHRYPDTEPPESQSPKSTKKSRQTPVLQMSTRSGLRRNQNQTDNAENSFNQRTSPSAYLPQTPTVQQSVEQDTQTSPQSATTHQFTRPFTRSMRNQSTELASPTFTVESMSSVKRSKRGSTAGHSRRSESVVHELRDGTTYVDEESQARTGGKKRGESVVHELRDGVKYVDE